MNAIQARDRLFSSLHASVLKPRGYKKSGSWSVKGSGAIHLGVYLRSSRWCNKSDASFWLDLKVFHEGWCALLTGLSAFPSLKENTPGLVYEELGSAEGPQHRQVVINAATDLVALASTLERRLREHAIPLEERCSTLEGILAYVRSRDDWPGQAMSAAGACLLLGREQQARELMRLAKDHAPHENTRKWLERQEEAMWKNRAVLASGSHAA